MAEPIDDNAADGQKIVPVHGSLQTVKYPAHFAYASEPDFGSGALLAVHCQRNENGRGEQ